MKRIGAIVLMLCLLMLSAAGCTSETSAVLGAVVTEIAGQTVTVEVTQAIPEESFVAAAELTLSKEPSDTLCVGDNIRIRFSGKSTKSNPAKLIGVTGIEIIL